MISSKELSQGLLQLLNESSKPDEVVTGFILFLEENNLLSILPHIIRHLKSHQEAQRNFDTLVIESPFVLSKETLSKIQKYSKADAMSPIKYVENKELLGGFRATYRGSVVDASLKNNLQALKKQLSN